MAASLVSYRVLARKYRPATFSDLVGQDVVVRTLTRAISSGRLAQAYVLSGVRGVGKTTIARILARALNCTGQVGTVGPTATPCGLCEHCCAIAIDRHVDVLEIDAASRTGVSDIRELIESVRYRPIRARYKVYIIDEVHMLSNQAFNALLKTLEEPPEHAKFIFATTEIRKVPITVLSRCQRFDLRRINAEVLVRHFSHIATVEGVAIEAEALQLIARAADGSVRDGLSLLDQAIAGVMTSGASEISVTAASIREMLGLADRTFVFELFDAVLQGNIRTALMLLTSQYEAGADPVLIMQDMLELSHWLTRLKAVPDLVNDLTAVAEAERSRGQIMAEKLSMAVLTRVWQMLLKAVREIRIAPSPIQAAEMILIRLSYAADLPTPDEVVAAAVGIVTSANTETKLSPPLATKKDNSCTPQVPSDTASIPSKAVLPSGVSKTPGILSPTNVLPFAADPHSLAEVVMLCQKNGEAILSSNLIERLSLTHFEPGRIEFESIPNTPPLRNLPSRLAYLLSEWTGRKWNVYISPGEARRSEQEQDVEKNRQPVTTIITHPLVKAVLKAFPGASIASVYSDNDDSSHRREGTTDKQLSPSMREVRTVECDDIVDGE